MRKILSFLIVAATIYFVACNVEEETISQTRELPTKNPYAISIPQAIERLNAIFPDATKTTRATTADVTTLTRGDFGLTTRAVNGALPTDPLIYIIPTDNNGCAIVGADERMEAVYAVLDNSTLTAEDILGVETRSDSQNEEDGEEIKEFVSAMLNDAITSNSSRIVGGGTTYPSNDTTILEKKVGPLLKTKWRQQFPYNVRFNIEKYQGLTGCGPLAVAQILYYFRTPSYILHSDSLFNWGRIQGCERAKYSISPTPTAYNEASRFIYNIAETMNAYYDITTNEVAVADSSIAKVFIRTDFSYNKKPISYKRKIVDTMMDKEYPIYTIGVTSDNQGHAWVIDGLKKYVTYLTSEMMAVDTTNYVHCNYGWGGECDGYYQEGVFNLNIMRTAEERELYDIARRKMENYSTIVKIFEYWQ